MPVSQNALERLARATDLVWQRSLFTNGWEYAILNGVVQSPLQGPFTALCRWPGEISYAPWISDADVEYFALAGEFSVNGHVLSPGDYLVVPPAIEGYLTSRCSGQALCMTRGSVVWAVEIFQMFRNSKLGQEDAQKLLRLPWIDHLRSQMQEGDRGVVFAALRPNVPPKVQELAISMARKFSGPDLNDAILAVQRAAQDLSLKVSATLYLSANKVIDPPNLERELKNWEKCPSEFLGVVRQFYAAETNRDLAHVVRERIRSWRMPECNRPFHELVLRLAEKSLPDDQ
jgi:hypothetical protein